MQPDKSPSGEPDGFSAVENREREFSDIEARILTGQMGYRELISLMESDREFSDWYRPRALERYRAKPSQ